MRVDMLASNATAIDATISQADQIIEAIAGRGNVVHTSKGCYLFTDSRQEVSAADIIAGAGNWAAEALDDMSTPNDTVVVAGTILSGRFDHASDLIKHTDKAVGAQIQQHISSIAARHA